MSRLDTDLNDVRSLLGDIESNIESVVDRGDGAEGVDEISAAIYEIGRLLDRVEYDGDKMEDEIEEQDKVALIQDEIDSIEYAVSEIESAIRSIEWELT